MYQSRKYKDDGCNTTLGSFFGSNRLTYVRSFALAGRRTSVDKLSRNLPKNYIRRTFLNKNFLYCPSIRPTKICFRMLRVAGCGLRVDSHGHRSCKNWRRINYLPYNQQKISHYPLDTLNRLVHKLPFENLYEPLLESVATLVYRTNILLSTNLR